MIVEVDAAPGDGGGGGEAEGAPGGPLGEAHGGVVPPADARVRGLVAEQQEQGDGDGEVGDELGVAAGHAVAAAVHAAGALLLDEALEREVEGLAGELAGEQERHLGLARRPDQRRVYYAQALRDQGQPRAQVRERVRWVLWRRE